MLFQRPYFLKKKSRESTPRIPLVTRINFIGLFFRGDLFLRDVIDLFRLGGLFSHFRPRDDTHQNS